jgi:hypothetical protein
MMKKFMTCLFLILALLLVAGGAQATLTIYTDRTAFSSQGTIQYNYDFSDVVLTNNLYFAPNPWTTHGVTYTTGDNLVVGPGFGYGNAVNVFLYNNWTPLTATFVNNYTMFAADIGVLGYTSPLDLQLTTNLQVYTYNGLVVPNVNTHNFFFLGGVLTGGEYFISGRIDSQYGPGSAPAITNATVGYTGVAPLPPSLLLFGSGLAGLAGLRRFRQN